MSRIMHSTVPFPFHRALVASCLLLAVTSGCRNRESPSATATQIQQIPLADKTPYQNRAHEQIEKTSRQYQIGSDVIPAIIAKAKTYLAAPSRFQVDSLELFVSDRYGVRELGDDRLLVLDYRSDELTEYVVSSRQSTVLAVSGEGPGDLLRSRELAVRGSTAYVVRSDQRISMFDCRKSPCVFSKEIPLEQRAYAIAPVDDQTIAVHTTTTVPMTTDPSVSLPPSESVTIVGTDGRRVRGFGETYDVDGHWMLINAFVAAATLDFSAEANQFLVTARRFPYLFVYDMDGELQKSYEVAEFVLGHDTYDPENGKHTNVAERHSVLDAYLVNDVSMILEVTTRDNRRIEGTSFIWDSVADYYFLRTDTGMADYLGAITSTGTSEVDRLIVLPNTLLLESGGELHVVQ